MSQAGRATFNEGIVCKSSTGGDFGLNINTASGDTMKLQVVDTGTAGGADGIITVTDGDFQVDASGDIILDAGGGDFDFKVGGTEIGSIIQDGNNMQLKSSISDGDMIFRGNDGGSIISALTLDMSNAGKANFNVGASFQDHVFLADNNKLVFGGGDDLQIYHDGSNSYIDDAGTGDLIINGTAIRPRTDAFVVNNAANNANMITAAAGGVAALYHNGSTKIATASGGVSVTGTAFVTDGIQDTGQAGSATVFNESGSTADFRVESDGNTHMLFVDGGNNRVGIGAVPQCQFAIQDSTTPELGFYRTSGATSGLLGRITMGNTDIDSGMGGLEFNQDGATNSSRIGFFTQPSGGASTERIRIDSSGNVGIGLSSGIDEKLHIKDGSLKIEHDSHPVIYLEDVGNSSSQIGVSGSGAGIDGVYIAGYAAVAAGTFDFKITGANGRINTRENLVVGGALSKASGSFKIDHPLESKKDTHHLVHSFVEAPQADNIYRGTVTLSSGTATVNLDTVAGMTEGTYVLLNTNSSCFTSNETDWDAVKGSVSGNVLTINCQNDSSTATVSWLVIGERQDQHMKDTDWTDADGKVIVEPLKETE